MKNETAVLQAKNKILNENLLKSALWLSGCDKRDSESSASPLLRKTGAHGMFLTAGGCSATSHVGRGYCRGGVSYPSIGRGYCRRGCQQPPLKGRGYCRGGVFSNLPNRAGLLSGGCSATSPPLQGAVVCGGGGLQQPPGYTSCISSQ